MEKIKSELTDCLRCDLAQFNKCDYITNCENLSDVDIIFISEIPMPDDFNGECGKYFSGESGTIFKKYFEKRK